MKFSVYGLLSLVNLLTPKNCGSRRVVISAAYGAHPRQRLDIYAPLTQAGPLPVIHFIYGGSWNDGDRRWYTFVARKLAAQGFVVVVPDYRLVPGVEYRSFIQDAADALVWAVDRVAAHGGDPDRIVLAGHSAGAYIAVMLALVPESLGPLRRRVRAVVGLSGPYDFFPFDVAVTMRTFGAAADPARTQPVNLVTADAPPMFLATGDNDTLVYPRNSVALAHKLRSANVPVVEKHYAGAGHAEVLLAIGSLGQRRWPVLADVIAFIRAHCG